ncbi:MAG: hypothetical protein ACAH80_01120 [Alphaproteobacteria bacterium]
MATKNSGWNSCTTQHFTSQYDDYVWPLPSGLIFAGAPPVSVSLA